MGMTMETSKTQNGCHSNAGYQAVGTRNLYLRPHISKTQMSIQFKLGRYSAGCPAHVTQIW